LDMIEKHTDWKLISSIVVVIIIVSSVPAAIYFLNFNGTLSDDSSIWADFGSYISGTTGSLLSTLSVLALVYTLFKTSRDNRITHELTLKSIEKAELQVKFMDREFKTNLLRSYISNFNQSLSQKEFFDYEGNELSQQEFVSECYRRLGNSIWARMSNNIPEKRRGFDFRLPGIILSECKTTFKDETKNLFYILDLIDRCEDEELKTILVKTYHSDINQDLVFWVTGYAYSQQPHISKILDRNMQSLLFMTERCAIEISAGTEAAKNNSAPPHSHKQAKQQLW
jgi:hypothetical protein